MGYILSKLSVFQGDIHAQLCRPSVRFRVEEVDCRRRGSIRIRWGPPLGSSMTQYIKSLCTVFTSKPSWYSTCAPTVGKFRNLKQKIRRKNYIPSNPTQKRSKREKQETHFLSFRPVDQGKHEWRGSDLILPKWMQGGVLIQSKYASRRTISTQG